MKIFTLLQVRLKWLFLATVLLLFAYPTGYYVPDSDKSINTNTISKIVNNLKVLVLTS